MRARLSSVAILTTTLITASMAAAQAQNVQNWISNEANKIIQDSASGLITPNQGAKLQKRQAQIQSQEQTELIQNGGFLTPQQSRQIATEEKQLDQSLNKDLRKNNPAINNGYYGTPTVHQRPIWNGYSTVNSAANPTVNPALNQAVYPVPGQQTSNNHRHHHHHYDGTDYHN